MKTVGLTFEAAPKSNTDIDFAGMSKAELEAYAAEHGIDISAAKTKAEIIGMLEAD